MNSSDLIGAFKYFNEMGLKDPFLVVTYTADDSNRLQNRFSSDKESQMNYRLFGDVLAFDATYKKNKHICPWVIFSSVNNHNQRIILLEGECYRKYLREMKEEKFFERSLVFIT